MWIVFLALIAVVVYLVVSGGKAIKKGEDETPLEILKKRYARGEISKQEFDRMKKDLE